MAGIEITADSPRIFPVTLVGKKYNVRVPKGSMGIQISKLSNADFEKNPEKIGEMLNLVIASLFTKKDATAIHKRLEDPEDPLDFEHLTQLSQAVVAAAADRPTS